MTDCTTNWLFPAVVIEKSLLNLLHKHNSSVLWGVFAVVICLSVHYITVSRPIAEEPEVMRSGKML